LETLAQIKAALTENNAQLAARTAERRQSDAEQPHAKVMIVAPALTCTSGVLLSDSLPAPGLTAGG
jgi:hypothetical protein